MDDLYRQFFGVVLVLAALVGLLWYARKRGFARLNIGANPNRLAKVIERIHLTPQHTLIIVSMDGRTLVLSTSPGSCQVLTEFKGESAP